MSRPAESAKTLGRALALLLTCLVATSNAGIAAGSIPRDDIVAMPAAPAHAGSHSRLVSISVTPESVTLTPGQTLQFAATGHYADGSAKDVTSTTKWKSSDASVVAFTRKDPRGLATAVADGTATISAFVSRVTGSASVTVGGPQPILESLEITPENAMIVEGGTVQYAATGQYSDATSRDITATVSWSSSDTAAATIDAAGLATAFRFGATTISATQDGASDSVVLTVVPRIESIEITPDDLSIVVGDQVQFEALAHFTDGSSSDMTHSVAWSSSDASVTIDAAGLAIGLAEGTTTIGATCDVVDLCASLSDSTTLTVSPTGPPPPPGESSQDLIDQDLADGVIDYPTSLEYRTWALFRDLRLPARYAGAPSAGEDESLFDELESEFDSLPADVQEAVTPYLVPPNDPQSAFGPAPESARPAESPSATTDPLPFEGTRCHAPALWTPDDWTPDGGGPDDGFRIWVCAASDAEAKIVFDIVKGAVAPLWEPMTRPEPNGMGKPVPDTVKGNTVNFGNGKIDIWVVYTSDCVDHTCPLASEGGFDLGVERRLSGTCGEKTGYPSHSCSGYIVLNAGQLEPPAADGTPSANLQGTLAHEFFHVLQDAHNADAFARKAFTVGTTVVWEKSWYYEASAMWAAWYYAHDPKAYVRFQNRFQTNNRSLLHFGDEHEYGSFVWPLMMQLELGASGVFQSWVAAEPAASPSEIDDKVDDTLRFADHFRDFSVRNLNPSEYFADDGVGLEADLWQGDVEDFPRTRHIYSTGGLLTAVSVAPLAADDAKFIFQDEVRQVTIDVASLTNAGNADIDVVGRLAPDAEGGPPAWNRIRGSGTRLTFCRDIPVENFDLIYVVISNHGRARAPLGGPDPDDALHGSYEITAKDACEVPDHYDAGFSGFTAHGDDWHGTATFDLIGTCSPADDVVYYCYRLVEGVGHTVTWNYTDDEGNNSTVTQPVGPSSDFGSVELRVRYPLPDFQGAYFIQLNPLFGGHVMPLPDALPRDAHDEQIFWIHTPFVHYIGEGFGLSGSEQLCGTAGCQGWTWDLQPRWDQDP